MTRKLIVYSRRMGCPYISLARRVLDDYALTYEELYIDQDAEARARVLQWTGFLSVPTLVVSHIGDNLPYEEPTPLKPGSSPRGINRGAMITEPNIEQLTSWLEQHGFIQEKV
jgi:glutaredoxin